MTVDYTSYTLHTCQDVVDNLQEWELAEGHYHTSEVPN